MANLNVTVNTEYNGRGIREAQADFENLDNKTIKQLQDRIKGLQQTLDNIRPNSSAFTRYSAEIRRTTDALAALQQRARNGGTVMPSQIGSATSSVVEFNRVIQDAPFGIQGVGNNIQALAQNFGYLVTQTGSAGAAITATFRSLISPVNLAILAVSALTTAWTFYAQSQQRANKEAKDALKGQRDQKQSVSDFMETLNYAQQVQFKSAAASAEESIKLRVLYNATQDVTMGLKNRNKAADELQKAYPEYFKSLTNEAILAGNAKTAYDELTNSILASAKARAAIAISGDNEQELVKLQLKRNQRLEDQAKIEERIRQIRFEAKGLGATDRELNQVGSSQNFFEKLTSSLPATSKLGDLFKELYDTQKELNGLQDTRTADGLREIQLKKDQFNLEKLINDELKKGADINGKPGKDTTPKQKDTPTDQINEALISSQNGVDSEGLKTYRKELELLSQEYDKYSRNIDKYVASRKKDGVDVTKQAEDAKTVLALQYIERRSTVEVGEAKRVQDEIQRIRDYGAVNSEQSAEKELAGVVKWYDAEIVKADGNQKIITAIVDSATAQREEITARYMQKQIDAYDKLADKVQAVEDQNFSQNKTGLASDTANIEKELQKRINKINELYDAMLKLNGQDITGMAAIAGLRAGSIATVTKNAKTAENSDDFLSAKNINAAIGDFTSKMYDSLASVGKKNQEITDRYNKAREGATAAEVARLNALERQEKALANSFGSVFSGIFDTLTSSMDSLFKGTLTNLLKTTFQDGLKNLSFGGLSSKTSGAIVAGAGLLGDAISSIGGGKNTVTSALGGGLKGAASGAVIGSAIPGFGTAAGAIIGGVAGVVGGIFSSSKARKQEELQKQQLEEQKKTNALIERQNQLAYSSSVIGRMTDRGVISGVDVNEFGQLTTTISGKDIVVSYDRTKASQARGN